VGTIYIKDFLILIDNKKILLANEDYEQLKDLYGKTFDLTLEARDRRGKFDKMRFYDYQIASEEEIRQNFDKLNTNLISMLTKLSKDFMREFKDKLNWRELSRSQEMDEDFMREFQDRIDFKEVSWKQKISEDFIREFQDKLDWGMVIIFQQMGKEFIDEFKDKINMKRAENYQHSLKER